MGTLFESIKLGLKEAVAHSKCEQTGIRLFTPQPVNVKSIREKTGLTQNQFAATFGISLGTLRHWERGNRKPHDPPLVLLNAANNAPDDLLRILTGHGFSDPGNKSPRAMTAAWQGSPNEPT